MLIRGVVTPHSYKKYSYFRDFLKITVFAKFIFYSNEIILGLRERSTRSHKFLFFIRKTEIVSDQLLHVMEKLSCKAGFLLTISLLSQQEVINSGRKDDILKACNPLKEYTWFVESVRKTWTWNEHGRCCR